MIEAVIYDMDGVLVDGEPFWRIAMIKGFNEVGIDFTDEDCRLTTGQRFDEVVKYWFLQKPWMDKSPEQLEKDVVNNLCQMIKDEGEAMLGASESLNFIKTKGLKIGLATSSSWQIVETVLNRLNIRDYFEAIESAEYLQYGKPHPEVFLNCAKKLNVKPEHCLVIEDSVNGCIAAKAARMQLVAIPEEGNRNNPKFSIADMKINSLMEINNFFIQ